MHSSHLHSVDILLVCVRVSAFARLVTFFIIILCGGTCVHLHLHTVRESYYCHLIKNAFCHCSLIISSHVPVNENMKYLSWLSDSNCSISPAAIWVLNNLFRNCMKVGPATML